MPSRVNIIYWSHSLADIKYQLKIKFGERHAQLSQTFEALCQTVSLAFGGKSNKGRPRVPKSEAYIPQTADEAMAAFNRMFG